MNKKYILGSCDIFVDVLNIWLFQVEPSMNKKKNIKYVHR